VIEELFLHEQASQFRHSAEPVSLPGVDGGESSYHWRTAQEEVISKKGRVDSATTKMLLGGKNASRSLVS
jgi:hypothetical protein